MALKTARPEDLAVRFTVTNGFTLSGRLWQFERGTCSIEYRVTCHRPEARAMFQRIAQRYATEHDRQGHVAAAATDSREFTITFTTADVWLAISTFGNHANGLFHECLIALRLQAEHPELASVEAGT